LAGGEVGDLVNEPVGALVGALVGDAVGDAIGAFVSALSGEPAADPVDACVGDLGGDASAARRLGACAAVPSSSERRCHASTCASLVASSASLFGECLAGDSLAGEPLAGDGAGGFAPAGGLSWRPFTGEPFGEAFDGDIVRSHRRRASVSICCGDQSSKRCGFWCIIRRTSDATYSSALRAGLLARAGLAFILRAASIAT
jgi:hypothetical protein